MSLLDEHIGARQVTELLDCVTFWTQFEYDNWQLISFTGKEFGRFGWLERQQYVKYVEVRAHQARFLLGVDPDVIDQFLKENK